MEQNVIKVGDKDIGVYLLAFYKTLAESKSNEVIIKARGNKISRAVDIAECLKRKTEGKVTVENVSIATEELDYKPRPQADKATENIKPIREGQKMRVSTIEIKLKVER